MTPHSKQLPRQTTQRKLARYIAELGILIIEGKKRKRPPFRRPFLLLQKTMTHQHPAQKSRLTPPTGQTRRRPQPAGDSSALPFARTNDAFPSANASLTRTNPSFAPAIDSIASASHLPSFELHSPVARANASFTSANEAKTSVSQLPSFPALSRGHQSTAPAKLLKTKHRPQNLASVLLQIVIRHSSHWHPAPSPLGLPHPRINASKSGLITSA
jgi:hypothetical protein